MDQEPERSRRDTISILPNKVDKNGGTGDMLSLANSNNNFGVQNPNANNPNTNEQEGQIRARHPSKNEIEMKQQIKSMYARGNFGDEDGFSQTIKSLDIAYDEDDLQIQQSKAVVMNHSILDSKDIAAHFGSQNQSEHELEEDVLDTNQQSDRNLIEKEEQKKSKIKKINSAPVKIEAIERSKTKSQYSTFKSRVALFEDDNSQESSDDDEESQKQALYKNFGIPMMNNQNEKVIMKPNNRFVNYQNIFQNLIKTTFVPTNAPIVSCELTRDSTRSILIMKNSEFEFFVVMYDLESQNITFKEKVGGKPYQYIKLNQVTQNESGTLFAVCYFDDGKFRIRTFNGKKNRSSRAIEEEEFDINAALDINNHTMPNQGSHDPYISSVFLSDEHLFVAFFHNKSKMHYHFIYLVKEKKILNDNVYKHEMVDSSKEDFPVQCFYNDHHYEIYCFYRQGVSLNIKEKDIQDVFIDQITDKDLGSMYLFDERALMVKSSAAIMFFKLESVDHCCRKRWNCYHQVEERGFIYYFLGNTRLNITTDEKIFFYLMDKHTLIPQLENVMYNYMGCSQLLFGSSNIKMSYCIPFKQDRKNFDICRLKYSHDLLCTIIDENLDKSLSIELRRQESFMVTKVDKVVVYDSVTFVERYTIDVDIEESATREKNEIIGFQTDQSEKYLVIIVGKNLILNEQMLEQIFVFKLGEGKGIQRFKQTHQVNLIDLEQFREVSPLFYFKNKKKGQPIDSLIFSRFDQIFEFNFVTSQVKPLYMFQKKLLRQPQHFCTNIEQNIFIIASSADVIYLSLEDEEEIDIDDLYDISTLCAVIFDEDDGKFYILSNGYLSQKGFFLLGITQGQPYQAEWLMKQSNNLDIGDACVHVIKDEQRSLKELIVSYKQIFLNTYNVMIIDVGNLNTMIFKHESFLLWELRVTGLFLNKNQDFIIFSKQGMSVLALGNIEKRVMKSNQGQDILIHSLESYNFLKHDKANFLMFQCSTNNKVISIQQEYQTSLSDIDNESQFEKIYHLNIGKITLRQALLFTSLYLSKNTQKIVELVHAQPNPDIFYTSLFELDGANMVSILSFESRSMQYLLSENFNRYFDTTRPLFYKIKSQKGNIIAYEQMTQLFREGKACNNKYFYRSAIDNALRNNQVRAIDLIIAYLVEYQNIYTSSFLFKKNVESIFEKGIEIKSLLDSKIFNMEFEYEEWPGIHMDNETVRVPYNNSIFKLRTSYDDLFPKFPHINEDPASGTQDDGNQMDDMTQNQANKANSTAITAFNIITADRSKIFKIKYQLNLLPVIGQHATTIDEDANSYNYGKPIFENEGVSILDLCSSSEEINIFLSDCLQELIEFKWDAFARKFHLVGLFMHLLYMLILVLYVGRVYIYNSLAPEDRDLHDPLPTSSSRNNIFAGFLTLGIIYPFLYEARSAVLDGLRNYFTQPWNYLDILLIGTGVLNIILHTMYDPLTIGCKVTISFVGFLGMGKTFFYLRIFENLSPIVTMLINVLYDLKVFLLFFFILIFMFAMQLSITGVANKQLPGPMRVNFYDPDRTELDDPNDVTGEPYEEYRHLNLFLGNFLMVFRCAMGDFSVVGTSVFLGEYDSHLFWVQFFLILVITNIVFINFVIAEAGNSYSMVQDKLKQVVLKERAKLIDEAEDLIPESFRRPEWYPKYIVVRKQAN